MDLIVLGGGLSHMHLLDQVKSGTAKFKIWLVFVLLKSGRAVDDV